MHYKSVFISALELISSLSYKKEFQVSSKVLHTVHLIIRSNDVYSLNLHRNLVPYHSQLTQIFHIFGSADYEVLYFWHHSDRNQLPLSVSSILLYDWSTSRRSTLTMRDFGSIYCNTWDQLPGAHPRSRTFLTIFYCCIVSSIFYSFSLFILCPND